MLLPAPLMACHNRMKNIYLTFTLGILFCFVRTASAQFLASYDHHTPEQAQQLAKAEEAKKLKQQLEYAREHTPEKEAARDRANTPEKIAQAKSALNKAYCDCERQYFNNESKRIQFARSPAGLAATGRHSDKAVSILFEKAFLNEKYDCLQRAEERQKKSLTYIGSTGTYNFPDFNMMKKANDEKLVKIEEDYLAYIKALASQHFFVSH